MIVTYFLFTLLSCIVLFAFQWAAILSIDSLNTTYHIIPALYFTAFIQSLIGMTIGSILFISLSKFIKSTAFSFAQLISMGLFVSAISLLLNLYQHYHVYFAQGFDSTISLVLLCALFMPYFACSTVGLWAANKVFLKQS